MSEPRVIRILHVVGGMNRGGVETWLMHVLRHIDREKFQMDFLVHTEKPCAYDDEIRALGSRIIPCMHPRNPLQYALNFRRILRDYGPYDVVHSHVHHFSGYVLWLAYLGGVPIRIAHSHNDTSRLQAQASFTRSIYLSVTEFLIRRYATNGVAASSEAGKSLFGSSWGVTRKQILYYGIDLAVFKEQIDGFKLRSELNIPQNAFVIGHVGRFDTQKNHAFVIEIAQEIFRKDTNVYFLLVGDGPLRPQIEEAVLMASLAEWLIFAGLRSDVPQIMLGAMDMFLMPSLYEGLPVTALEAQAAGLRCILSDTISPEVSIVQGLVRWLSLSQPARVWAETILEVKQSKNENNFLQTLDSLSNSPFNIVSSVNTLSRLYSN